MASSVRHYIKNRIRKYFILKMGRTIDFNEISARKFIDHCKSKFGWSDLSEDVIMDVGCGELGHCGKAIFESFPDVGTIIFVDKQPQVESSFQSFARKGFEFAVADIEKRDSLGCYEDQMTKVVSTHVFHQLMEKEKAFRNMYHLLKPGGEAAVLFVMKSLIYDWLTEMLKNPKWKKVYRGHYAEGLYKSGLGTVQYMEMVEKIGFQIVDCLEENRVIPSDSDEICKEEFYRMYGEIFEISPESVIEFKEDTLQVLLRICERDQQRMACYRSTELSLLLIKPTEVPDSETEENPGA